MAKGTTSLTVRQERAIQRMEVLKGAKEHPENFGIRNVSLKAAINWAIGHIENLEAKIAKTAK